MGHQKKRSILDPVLENCTGPPISVTRRPSMQYKPHKYGSPLKLESQCRCLSPLSFFGKLRDRYIKAMNEMAMGGDFTAVTGYHGWAEYGYTLQHCKSVIRPPNGSIAGRVSCSHPIKEPSAAALRSRQQVLLFNSL